VLRVEEGSLYPALHRIEKLKWITSEWSTSASGRRVKLYAITAEGRRQLAAKEQRWNDLAKAVGRVLRFV
jgi:DNA-binding PadR family transcriptional regulator